MKNVEEANLSVKGRRVIRKIKEALEGIIPDGIVILFGSRARGAPDDDSDWDILILADEVTDEIDHQVSVVLYDIELEHDAVINPLILPKDEWYNRRFKEHPIHKNVDREGLLVK